MWDLLYTSSHHVTLPSPLASGSVNNVREKQHETIYIPLSGGAFKPIPLKKLRGFALTAVAWNPDVKADDGGSTREILLGTSQSQVLETEIDRGDKYVKQVFKVDAGPVTGLRIERVRLRPVRSRAVPVRSRAVPPPVHYHVLSVTLLPPRVSACLSQSHLFCW